MRFLPVTITDRVAQPLVIRLLGEAEHPARHRDRHPHGGVGRGQFLDEREHYFGGADPIFKFACDRYAVARRRISLSISSSWIRFSIFACSRCPSRPPDGAGVTPRPSRCASRTHTCNADFETPISAHTCFCDIPCVSTIATASRLNSSEYFTGMTAILPT